MLLHRVLIVLCVGGLALAAAAEAETYRVVGGTLDDGPSGSSEAFSGEFEISISELGDPDFPTTLRIDDFQLQAGDQSFRPPGPIEFAGRSTLLIRIADHIYFDGDAVGFFFLRSGGELVAVDPSEVTFRFVDLRPAAPNAGRLTGQLGDSLLPRRISLVGSVREVDQRLRLPQGNCLPTPPKISPPPDGTAGAIMIRGRIVAVRGGAEDEMRVAALEIAPAPGLDELGITAPSGAEVTFDDAGVLTVHTEGDLLVTDAVIDIPGLTSVSLIALGRVSIEGRLEVPSDVTLRIEAGEIAIEDGSGVIPPLPPIVGIPICDDLRPVFPADTREVGHFSLLMSAARQVEIDVDSTGYGPRIERGRHGIVSVAILGSADFDVRDVDERSLRVGPDEAEPTSRRGRSHRVDVNRDGEMDVVVRFEAEQTGITPADSQLCLFGQTTDGAWIEGCDAIEAQVERGYAEDPHPTGRDR
jgi:hypothetical protein